jgi:hypothetical protein
MNICRCSSLFYFIIELICDRVAAGNGKIGKLLKRIQGECSPVLIADENRLTVALLKLIVGS